MAARRLIFLGKPGSGKGTQARRISKRCGHVVLSSGDIFRAEISAGTEIGQKVSQVVEQGRLVPDDIVTTMMLGGVSKLGPQAKFILDGYPRTIPQAESLTIGLQSLGVPVERVIHFRIDDPIIVQRALERRVCRNCNWAYNVRFFPPRADGVCDQCGGPVEQRADDRENVVRQRLEAYHRQTEPLEEFYSRAGLLCEVDASAPADVVEAAVAAIVDPAGRS